MQIIEKDYLDIPLNELTRGEVLICFDPQKRLGEKTFAVVIVEGSYSPPDAKGLFWDKASAKLYAEALTLALQ